MVDQRATIKKAYLYAYGADGHDDVAGTESINYQDWADDHIQDRDWPIRSLSACSKAMDAQRTSTTGKGYSRSTRSLIANCSPSRWNRETRMTEYREPDVLPEAVSSPCNECPWRRESAAGWLGPYSAKQWVRIAHSDGAIACHKTVKRSDSWEGARQCAGAASFRANVCKSPRSPTVARGPQRDDIFATNQEFVEHHTQGKETWSLEDMWA